MKTIGGKIAPCEGAAGHLIIECLETGLRMPWNEACAMGWVCGQAPFTYYSPSGFARASKEVRA